MASYSSATKGRAISHAISLKRQFMIWLTEVIRDEEGNAIGLGGPLPDEQVIPMLRRMEYFLNEKSLGFDPRGDLLYDCAESLYREQTIRRSQRIIILQDPQTIIE